MTLERTRETNGGALGLSIAAQFGVSLLVNAVFFQGALGEGLIRLHRASSGLVTPTLVSGCVSLGAGSFLAFRVCRLRPSDVGWRLRDLLPAAFVVLGFWLATEGARAIAGAGLSPGTWRIREAASGVSLLGRTAQLLINTFAEETVFRGLFLPQLFFPLSRRIPRRFAVALAIVASQAVFALCHLPNRVLVKEASGASILSDQGLLFVSGVLLAALYLVSGNLFLVVGVHAVANVPVAFARVPVPMWSAIWSAGTLLLLASWWVFARIRAGTKRTGRA